VRGLIACHNSWLNHLAQRLLSNIELTLLVISMPRIYGLGNEAFIAASEYIGFPSLKTLHPCGLPL
jgi:hypothetical protein